METLASYFVLPRRQIQIIQENLFKNVLIRRTAVAMNTNAAVVESLMKNSFKNQQFYLRELRIIRVARAIVSLETSSPCCPYVATTKAMQFNEKFSAIPMENFQIN